MAKNPALELYLWMLENVHSNKNRKGSFQVISQGAGALDGEVDYNVLWARLRAARLFNVPVVLMEDTYDEVAGYISSLVRLGEEDELSPEEGTDLLIREGINHPFPDKMPFDHVLLLYPWTGLTQDGRPPRVGTEQAASIMGSGIVLDDEQLAFRYGPDVVPKLREFGIWSVFGHLISHDGQAWELLRWTSLTVEGTNHRVDLVGLEGLESLSRDTDITVASGFAATRVRDLEKWWSPLSMTPWVLSAVIGMINDYKTLVVEKPKTSDRMAVKRWAKKRRLKSIRPPMYYGIMLQDNVVFLNAVRDQFEKSKDRKAYLNFQSDVRGHERCRIRRGPMPMGPRDREKYQARGYTLYEQVMDLDSEDEKRLRERGMPLKERGEWLAIKTTWVNSYMKGPEGAPYRPAIRHLPVQPPVSWGGDG